MTTRVRVVAHGVTAVTELRREWLAGSATAHRVSAPGVRGLFCRPGGDGPFRGVVAFGGSGGGLGPSAAWAQALASRGLAVLCISYFGEPGQPSALHGI